MLTIHDVLDARAVTPLFQPLVDIATGRVLGYEALSRGPAGTSWESPAALFAAARAAGREHELDWICRARAYQAVLAAGPDPRLTWFVNMEPPAARTACPADLLPVVEQARHRLRVVTEMTERAIAADPSGLLSAAAACRVSGWGVALDDVGADPMSLALMPFVHPDVVKLDMQMLRAPGDPHTARVVAAVAAYAESTGAVVLAEGIETEEHLSTAMAMGATLGQGWLFGRPGALDAPQAPPARPIALVGTPPAVSTEVSPFEVVRAPRDVRRGDKRLLIALSLQLEHQAAALGESALIVSAFQSDERFTELTRRRYTMLGADAAFVAALGVGMDPEPAPGVRGASLEEGDPLTGEWSVAVLGPHFAAALVAVDLGDTGPEMERRFDFALTYDRDLVVEAASALMRRVQPLGG